MDITVTSILAVMLSCYIVIFWYWKRHYNRCNNWESYISTEDNPQSVSNNHVTEEQK